MKHIPLVLALSSCHAKSRYPGRKSFFVTVIGGKKWINVMNLNQFMLRGEKPLEGPLRRPAS